MPRKIRVEYAGAIYHVMSRANITGAVFLDDVDRQAEGIIREELQRLGWTEEDLRQRARRDPAKLALAARVRSAS